MNGKYRAGSRIRGGKTRARRPPSNPAGPLETAMKGRRFRRFAGPRSCLAGGGVRGRASSPSGRRRPKGDRREKLAAIRDAAGDRKPAARDATPSPSFDAVRPGLRRDRRGRICSSAKDAAHRGAGARRGPRRSVDRGRRGERRRRWNVKALLPHRRRAAAKRRGWKEAADIYAKARRVGLRPTSIAARSRALYREIGRRLPSRGDNRHRTSSGPRGRRSRTGPRGAEVLREKVARRVSSPTKDRGAPSSYRIGKSAAGKSGDAAGAAAEWTELAGAANAGRVGRRTRRTALGQAKRPRWARMAEGAGLLREGPRGLRRRPRSRRSPLIPDRRDVASPLQTRSEEELPPAVVEAWTQFVKALPVATRKPRRPSLRNGGDALSSFGRPREAIEAYRAFLARVGRSTRARPVRAGPDRHGVSSTSGDFDRAVAEWQNAPRQVAESSASGRRRSATVANASFQKGPA